MGSLIAVSDSTSLAVSVLVSLCIVTDWPVEAAGAPKDQQDALHPSAESLGARYRRPGRWHLRLCLRVPNGCIPFPVTVVVGIGQAPVNSKKKSSCE